LKDKNVKGRLNISLIRCRREYSYKEIAELFNRHPRTVQSWRRQGLNILAGTAKPILILGAELKRFLQEKRRKKKRPLEIDEFYCCRCGEPRESIPYKISVELTGKLMGYGNKQLRIRGICNVCTCSLSRLSSENKFKLIENFIMKKSHRHRILIDDTNSYPNTDIEVEVNEQDQY
jgi:hypothetical protein